MHAYALKLPNIRCIQTLDTTEVSAHDEGIIWCSIVKNLCYYITKCFLFSKKYVYGFCVFLRLETKISLGCKKQ